MSKARKWRLIATPWSPRLLPARLVSLAEGYAMVRRRGATPFVVTQKAWDDAPIAPGKVTQR